MARGRASACLSVALWVWCVSVSAAQHPEGPSDNRPVIPPLISANVTSPAPSPPPPPPTVTRMQKPPQTTDGGAAGVDSRLETEAQGSSGKEAPVREAASKRNTSFLPVGGIGSGASSAAMRAAPSSSSSSATAEQLRSATSLAGNLALLLISVVIAGALFVMVVCFIHKWKENMGTGRYPRVVYSMLRQSEDEPEDVLGEILINIGLAAPGDTCPRTPSSSSSSSRCSPAPAEPDTMDIHDLEGSKFTTIPLRSDEAAKRLMAPEPEESDEELLQ